jgi:hypothetical protein
MEEEPVPRAPRPCPSRTRDLGWYSIRISPERSELVFRAEEEDERQGAKNAKERDAKGGPAGRAPGVRELRPPKIRMAAAASGRYYPEYEPQPAGARGILFCLAGAINHELATHHDGKPRTNKSADR